MRQDFASALDGRRRARDARVVARITADPGSYLDCIRGGPPDAAEWRTARLAAARDLAGASGEDALLPALRALLGDLQPGCPVTVAEIGAEGITTITVDLDQFGSPRVSGPVETTTWESMLPMLSARPEERRFQLAGGMSQPDLEQILQDAGNWLPELPAGPLRVICRLAGWEIPERAAQEAAARPGAGPLRVAGTAEATPVPELLVDLATRTPLKDAYQLMVAAIAPGSGAVSIQPRELFAPGTPPGTKVSLPLRRMPGGGQELTLAIFAGDGPAPLALRQVRAPAASFSLRAVLRGPGRVEILEPEHTSEYPRGWDSVRDQVPARVSAGLGPVDLVCAIDLSGTDEAVEPRVKLVRRLVRVLREQYGDSPLLRVGVVTCTEHTFERGQDGDRVTERLEPGPVSRAAAWLKDQAGQRGTNRHQELAPVEDLLHEAYDLLRGSRDSGRAPLLVTVAGRPPHPWPQPRDKRLPCPNGYTWGDEMGKLTRWAGARCVMVADDPAAGLDGAAGWRQLGPGGLRALAETNSQRLAESLDLVASPAQRLPLPIPDDYPGGIT
jgi:hypothetical protein